MTARLIRLGLLTIFTVGGAIVAVLLTDKPARTQEPKDDAAKGRNSSLASCKACHGGKSASAYSDFSKEAWGNKGPKVTDFVRLDEFETWENLDLHYRSYERIDPAKSELASVMQKNMASLKDAPADYKITHDIRCLACHSTDMFPGKKDGKAFKDFNMNSNGGVSCEACHSTTSSDWVGPHFQPNSGWREKDPGQKKLLGLADLRDPVARTAVCASCHVGNLEEGKFVTHQMYAAGHPPLPAFELVTFSRDQPAHYHTPTNKALDSLSPESAKKLYHYSSTDIELNEARNLAHGAVGTLKAYSDLIATAAAKAGPNDVLDFALFDCYACHHELKIPSYRQTRGYKGAPGRPSLPAWPSESTRVLLKSLEGVDGIDETRKKFEAASAAMQKAIDLKPFGSPVDVVKAAKPLGESCDGIQAELAKLTFDTARTEKLYATWLEFVKNTPKDKAPGADGLYLDYFGAQQAGWTIRALQDGLRGRAGLKVSLPSAESTEARQNSLGASVSLELRSSKSSNVEPSAKLFNDRLQKLGSFQLAPFLDAMNDFVKPLPPASK